ncbi:MAG: DinB family protein [Planctomycetes bacterium]|nr:DinB family protein [Planctomycetota bacterium]
MYTPEALLDVHERCHRSFGKLLAHCRAFTVDEINRELPGFGYPTIRLQLHHLIGAEDYWLSVVRGAMRVDDNDAAYPTIESLETWRASVAAETRAWLAAADADALNTARPMKTWGGGEHSLIPAHILMRTQVHIFQHQGQVAAMCRLLGKPIPAGLDFPLG